MAQDSQKETLTGGFKIEDIQSIIREAEVLVVDKMTKIKGKSQDEVNIGDMFDMQWMMNKFSQLSEMSSSVLAACHQVIASLNRNLKG
jgi:Family of unknown function (DUF5407)